MAVSWLKLSLLLFAGSLCSTSVLHQWSIYEKQSLGRLVLNVNNVLGTQRQPRKFSMLGNNDQLRIFHLDENTGEIRTVRMVDRQNLCGHSAHCLLQFDVLVSEDSNFEIVSIVVNILDVNDHDPIFPMEQIELQVPEDSRVGSSFLIPGAKDLDIGNNSVTRYEIMPSNSPFNLKRDARNNGDQVELLLSRPLDRETQEFYQFFVLAVDGGIPARSGSILVNVSVRDSNDHIPVFERSNYEVRIRENISINSSILQVHATDEDLGVNGQIVYSLSSRNAPIIKDLMYINERTGDLKVKGKFDRESVPVLQVIIDASDKGEIPSSAFTTVIIIVDDVNDSPPTINIYPRQMDVSPSQLREINWTLATVFDSTPLNHSVAYLPELAPVGTFVALVTVDDADTGENSLINCRIFHSSFKLREESKNKYSIVSSLPLDRETNPVYELFISASDHGIPPLNSSVVLLVVILDENDNTPKFPEEVYRADVVENSPIGTTVLTLQAYDNDAGTNAEIVYSLVDNEKYFQIDPVTGVVSVDANIDREVMSAFNLTVIAQDKGMPSLSAIATVEITVLDENDNPPIFNKNHYTFVVGYSTTVPNYVGTLTARDVDEAGNGSIIYSFLKPYPGFDINATTGAIFTTLMLVKQRELVYHLVVLAVDADLPQLVAVASIDVVISDLDKDLNTTLKNIIDAMAFPSDNTSMVSSPLFITLIVASSVVIIIIIIFIILYRNKDRTSHLYNVRKETARIFQRNKTKENGNVPHEEPEPVDDGDFSWVYSTTLDSQNTSSSINSLLFGLSAIKRQGYTACGSFKDSPGEPQGVRKSKREKPIDAITSQSDGEKSDGENSEPENVLETKSVASLESGVYADSDGKASKTGATDDSSGNTSVDKAPKQSPTWL